MSSARSDIRQAVTLGSMLAGAIITLSVITILDAWEHQDTKQLLGGWERLYYGGLVITRALRFLAALLYVFGAWKATHNQKHLMAAALLTAIGDPITWTYMDHWTWELRLWRDKSMSYSPERSYNEHEPARDAVLRWSVAFFLRALESLLGVWWGWKYMPDE